MTTKNSDMELAITGMGMVTPVGLDVATSCASIRAGISGLEEFTEFPYKEFSIVDGEIVNVVGARISELTNGHLGFGRLSRLALPAFEEAILTSQLKFDNKIKYIIAVPELERPGRDERIEKLLANRLARSINLASGSINPQYIYSGHASAIIALQTARQILQNQEADHVVIGGVESLLDPANLVSMQGQNIFKSDSKPDGINPGEASFFIIVESEITAQKRNVETIAFIKGIAVGNEKNIISSCNAPTGEALSEVLFETLKFYRKELPINMIISDLNGSRYRSTEWSYALVRSLKGIEGSLNMYHHADCIGDTCSASSGISIIFAAKAIARGYAKGDNALVWASSDNGKRASIIVERGNNGSNRGGE